MPPSKTALAKRQARHTHILAAARRIAEDEGWPAVTVRRLATEIAFTQPVLYTHFENREAIVTAVAVQGFQELGQVLQTARIRAKPSPFAATAAAYLTFSAANPALYQAMFSFSLGVPFADPATPPELRFAFAQLLALFPPRDRSAPTRAELLWAAFHGIAELTRTGRLPARTRKRRLQLLVGLFAPA